MPYPTNTIGASISAVSAWLSLLVTNSSRFFSTIASPLPGTSLNEVPGSVFTPTMGTF
jgi:hypothetical protein